MQIISFFSPLLENIVSDFTIKAKLNEYLVYGSFAFAYYTNLNIEIHDVDILVKREHIEQIASRLEKFNDYCTVYRFDGGLHVNLNNFTGLDNKPFDISIDALDRVGKDINLSEFTLLITHNVRIKLIKKEELLQIYKIAVKAHPEKKHEYEKKVDLLT